MERTQLVATAATDASDPLDPASADPRDLIRYRLMLDGWEFVRLGHQILAGTNASPGPTHHTEAAEDAVRRAEAVAGILDALRARRRRSG